MANGVLSTPPGLTMMTFPTRSGCLSKYVIPRYPPKECANKSNFSIPLAILHFSRDSTYTSSTSLMSSLWLSKYSTISLFCTMILALSEEVPSRMLASSSAQLHQCNFFDTFPSKWPPHLIHVAYFPHLIPSVSISKFGFVSASCL